ncbi:MAG: hypothetical protein SGILL_006951 [Bacillariaceae sp.]
MAPAQGYHTSSSTFVSPTGLINSVPRSKAKAGSKRTKGAAAPSNAPSSAANNNNNNNSLSSSSSLSSSHRDNGNSYSYSNSNRENHQQPQPKRQQRGRTSGSNSNQRMHTSNSVGSGGMVAAESLQRAFDHHGEDSRVRRRTLDEAGHFKGASPSTSPIPSPPPIGSVLQDPPTAPPSSTGGLGNPFMCASIPAFSSMTTPGSNAHQLTQKVSQTSMQCRQRYGPVASKAAGQAKKGMAEFAVIASEVYRQECRSDNRGADDEFFSKERQSPYGDNNADNSMQFLEEDNSLLSLSEQRDNTNEISPQHPNGSLSRSTISPEAKRPNMVVTPSTAGSSSSERLTPPPRVDRRSMDASTTSRNFSSHDDEASNDQDVLSSQDFADPLRGARMELFRNQVAGVDNPEERLARALDDLNRQDVFVQSLKRQMQMTQTTLDDTTLELEEVKTMAKEKQYKATEIRARAVQEKKRLEDLYQTQVQEGKDLIDKVETLQREVATLKTSLRSARNSSNRSPFQDSNNTQMISMRAELVELRSQLAEAHAVNIDDSSARQTPTGFEELKKKLQQNELELKDLKQKCQDGLLERQGQLQTERELREQLSSLQSSSKETKSLLEENLLIAMKTADDSREELVKTKANVQRLERERTRARLHSSGDVERAQKDLVKAHEEHDRLKDELTRSRAMAKAERKQLTNEIDQLKEQLQSINKDHLAQSAEMMREQRKLQDEVTCNVAEIRGLKEACNAKDDELRSKTKQVADMELTIQALKQGAHNRASDSLSKVSRDLEFSQNNHDAALKEAKMYKALLEEARSIPAASRSHDFLKGINNDVVEQIKRRLERLHVPAPHSGSSLETSLRQEIASVKRDLIGATPGPETVQARSANKEDSFLNEMSSLKSKLAEAQTKIHEETVRAQEERRVNREDERDRRAEMDRLQHEKDAAIKAQTSLESEVVSLRKKLEVSSSPRSPAPTLSEAPQLVLEKDSSKCEDVTGVPSNVKRLRGELAQARERLAAARENSRSLPVRPTASPGPIHEPSAWGNRVTSSTETSATVSIRRPEPTPAHAFNGQPCAQPRAVDINVAAPRLSEELTKPAFAKSLSPKPNSPRSTTCSSKSFSMEELTRQLELSRKRLQTADKRLNGLVGAGSLSTIVRESISDSSFDGSIDEVVTEDGSIEVSHRRFADV